LHGAGNANQKKEGIMAIPRKVQMRIEELRAAGLEVKELIKGLSGKEGKTGRIFKDLEKLQSDYERKVLEAVYGDWG